MNGAMSANSVSKETNDPSEDILGNSANGSDVKVPLPSFSTLIASVSRLKNENLNSSHNKEKQSLKNFESQENFSGKHNFPFRMVKSYPKVYYSKNKQVINQDKKQKKKCKNINNLVANEKPLPTKHDLLKKIDQTDREITETEKKIKILKSEAEKLPRIDKNRMHSLIKNLSDKIYCENRKKAEESDKGVYVFKSGIDLSDRQPGDIQILKDISEKFQRFRPILVRYLREKKYRRLEEESKLTRKEAGERLVWSGRLAEMEAGEERRARLLENVEFFEKVFPELRLEREHKEILRSATVRTRNQPYVKDYAAYLKEKLHETNPNSALLAADIPRLLNPRQRSQVFLNSNNRLVDVEAARRLELADRKRWTEKERELFKEKYLEYPKNFAFIASSLQTKNVQDCVLHYYLSKRSENYKELVCLRDGRRTGRKWRLLDQTMTSLPRDLLQGKINS